MMGFMLSAKFWKYISSILLSLIVLFGVAGFFYVNQAGGLAQLIESKFNNVSGKIDLKVGSARIGAVLSLRPLVLKTYDVYINAEESSIKLPVAEFEFGLTSLTTGKPEKLVFRGLELDLVKTTEGWSGHKIFGFIGMLSGKSAKNASAQVNHGLQKIGIDDFSITLADASGQLPSVKFSNLYLDFELLSAGALSGSLRGRHTKDEENAGNFTATFTGWPGDERFLVDVTAQDLKLDDTLSYIEQMPIELKHLGTFSGHLGLSFNASQIEFIEADISLKDGVAHLPNFILKREYKSVDITATYARGQNALNVARSEIILVDGRQFSFAGAVDNLRDEFPFVEGRFKANNLPLQTMLEDWPVEIASTYKLNIQSRLSGGYLQDINAQIAGYVDMKSRSFNLSKCEFSGNFSGIRVDFFKDQYRRVVGTAGGKVHISMGKQGWIDDLNFEVEFVDGAVLLAGYEEAVMVPEAHIRTSFSKGVVNVETATINFGHSGKLSISGMAKLTDDYLIEKAKLTVDSMDFDVALFSALWPDTASPETLGWIRNHVPEGRLRDAKLILTSAYDADNNKHALSSIKGDLKLSDAILHWSDKALAFSNISADLTIDDSEFVANVTNAHMGDMNVQHGKVVIASVDGDGQSEADILIAFKGALGEAFELAKLSGLKTIAGFDILDSEVSGEAEVLLQARFPIGKTINAMGAIQKLDATISNGSFTNFSNGVRFNDSELVVAFDKDRSDASGTAMIMGAPGKFSIQLDRNRSLVTVIALASPSSELAALLARASGMKLGGQLGGKLVYNGDLDNKTGELQIAVPLSGVSINIPSLNWAKLPAESGQAMMIVNVRNGAVAAISDIDVVAGSLVAKGQAAFDTAGHVQAGFFERVAWPGNDIRDLIFESNQDKSWKVGASAKIIDLVPVRRNKGVSGGEKINFDITADQIIVDDQISLSGQLVGVRSALGAGNAEFSGSMLVQGKPLIKEAQFRIEFGAGDETIKGIGLVGGGETDFFFIDALNKEPELILTSKNGGRMLSGLDITNTVRGGDVKLHTIFNGTGYKFYDTRIDMSNFSVVEAPRAIRALSVLSLAGLYSLVEGDGTAFKVGQAQLETRGSIVNIRSLKASGDAVGVSLLGVYDRETKRVDVSGNLVPASQLNKIAGKLPVLGGVFTGLDKSGLFTVQFSVSGRSDDMQTSINIASVAPGLLRDLFSPDWLSREDKRLFDDEQNAHGEQTPASSNLTSAP